MKQKVKIERRESTDRRCECNTCSERTRLHIEISKDVSEAITDIVKENGINVDDVIEDALRRHPIIEDRMMFLKDGSRK